MPFVLRENKHQDAAAKHMRASQAHLMHSVRWMFFRLPAFQALTSSVRHTVDSVRLGTHGGPEFNSASKRGKLKHRLRLIAMELQAPQDIAPVGALYLVLVALDMNECTRSPCSPSSRPARRE
jgi:hypothetical protein